MNDHGISVADRLSDLTACIDFLDRAGRTVHEVQRRPEVGELVRLGDRVTVS